MAPSEIGAARGLLRGSRRNSSKASFYKIMMVSNEWSGSRKGKAPREPVVQLLSPI